MRFLFKLFLAVTLFTAQAAIAKNITLDEIQDVNKPKVDVITIDKDNWIFKTLNNINTKYNLNDKSTYNKPISRNEAAILLIEAVNRLNENKIKLTESEKAQFDMARQALNEELSSLQKRVAVTEKNTEVLQGRVSNLEKEKDSAWKFEYGKNYKLCSVFQVRYAGNITRGADRYPGNVAVPLTNFGITGNIAPNLDYNATLLFNRYFDGRYKTVVGDMYIFSDKIPKHIVTLGLSRIPIGYEGAMAPAVVEVLNRAQIARNFNGDLRDAGLKITGNWKPVEYLVGIYNGKNDYKHDNDGNLDLATQLIFKPLYKNPELGSLKLGGGYYTGRNTYHNDVLSFYGAYKLKKYEIIGEYEYSDGRYGGKGRKSDGFYIHNTYFLTDKLQLLARYDQFDPNKKNSRDLITEYTLGANYYFFKNNLKLGINLVDVVNKANKDSRRIVTQLQYKI